MTIARVLRLVGLVSLLFVSAFSDASVLEQILVQTLPDNGPPHVATGSRFGLVVNSQRSKGLIAASQFIGPNTCADPATGAGGYWLQFGYQMQAATGPTPIAFAFVVPQNAPSSFAQGPALTAATHVFSLVAAGDGSSWIWSVDGVAYYAFHAGCSSFVTSTALDAYEQIDPVATRPIRLKDLRVTSAFEFLIDGVWTSTPFGGYRTGYTCPADGCSFDAQGTLQNATLTRNQILWSTRAPFSRDGVRLW